MFALLFALAGIWLLLGAGGWPLPQNLGDVFGILAGMFWALGLTMMRGQASYGVWNNRFMDNDIRPTMGR